MLRDAAERHFERWTMLNEPNDGLTEFEIEPFRTIEIVGPAMPIRAESLREALEVAIFQVEVEGCILNRLQWNPKALQGCLVQEDRIDVRRAE